jgi:uncharacterized protein (TIGR02145 family)
MKLKNIFYYLMVIIISAIQLKAQTNTNPIVSNVAFSISGTTVTVTYDVYDAEQDAFTISMRVSSNNGSTWDFSYGSATGAIGVGVNEGTNKNIQWTYTGGYNPNFKIRIYANDETTDGSPCAGVSTVNYGGKTYGTIQIGTQCWLKENLDIGIKIDEVINQSDDGNIEKYCYDDLDANCTTYGGLYQWNEAIQYVTTEGTQGICPIGWHIPTKAQLQTFSDAVGGNGFALLDLNAGGTNTSGFSALLAGFRGSHGIFGNLYNRVYFWSSTEGILATANYLRLHSDGGIYFFNSSQEYGFSVRCIKN